MSTCLPALPSAARVTVPEDLPPFRVLWVLLTLYNLRPLPYSQFTPVVLGLLWLLNPCDSPLHALGSPTLLGTSVKSIVGFLASQPLLCFFFFFFFSFFRPRLFARENMCVRCGPRPTGCVRCLPRLLLGSACAACHVPRGACVACHVHSLRVLIFLLLPSFGPLFALRMCVGSPFAIPFVLGLPWLLNPQVSESCGASCTLLFSSSRLSVVSGGNACAVDHVLRVACAASHVPSWGARVLHATSRGVRASHATSFFFFLFFVSFVFLFFFLFSFPLPVIRFRI